MRKSLEVNRVLQSQVADNDEDFEGLSEEQQARYETARGAPATRSRSFEKRYGGILSSKDGHMMENAADLIAAEEMRKISSSCARRRRIE